MGHPPAEAAEVVRPPVWLLMSSGFVFLSLGASAVTGFFLRKTALGSVLIYVFAAVASFSLLLIPLQLSMPPVSLLILWLPGFSGLWILTVMLRLREDQSG